jgi:methyl-accepting chemotaxis protein
MIALKCERDMKISTVLTVALSVIGVIAFAKFGSSALTATRDYVLVEQLRDLVQLRSRWINGIVSLSQERSLSQVMLTVQGPIGSNFTTMRDAQSTAAAADFDFIRAELDAVAPFPTKDAFTQEMEKELQTIQDLRAKITAQLNIPYDQRDHSMSANLIAQFKSEVSEMRSTADYLVSVNEQTSTEAIMLAKMQESAWEMREFGGRARSIYAIATLHQRPISIEDLVYAKTNLLRADEAWNSIKHIKGVITLPQIIQEQFERIEQNYGGEYHAMTQTINAESIIMTVTEKKAMARTLTNAEETFYAAAMQAGESGEAVGEDSEKIDSISFDTFFSRSAVAMDSTAFLAQLAGKAMEDYWDSRATTQRNLVGIDIAALLVVIGVILFTLRSVSRRITLRLRAGLTELAALSSGTLDRNIARHPKDLAEINALSDGLDNLQAQLRRASEAQAELARAEQAQQQIVQQLSEGLKKLSTGDLSARILGPLDAKYQSLADDFNAATASLADVVSKVVDTAGSVLSGARGINEATVDLSKRTEVQGATLQSAASSLEMLTQSIVASRGDAQELDSLASLAHQKGSAMTETMSQTVAAIEKIKSSSHEIELIVSVIEDIAFQTNLLALNAGVEATRAGAEGSGFAVIAAEVRSLATRSSQSANEIKALIATSGIEVTKGVEFVTEAEASVSDISTHIHKISALISRIAANSRAQSEGLMQVNDGVSQLDLVTQTNVAMVEETTAECQSLSLVAQDLSQLVSRFNVTNSTNNLFALGDFGQSQKIA